MKNTILIGPSGFLGPAILEKYPSIIAVGRKKPPFYCKNKFIHIKNIYNLKKLDRLKIDYVIFLIGNSNHHILNKKSLDNAFSYNVYPLESALNYFSNRNIKKIITFSGALVYDEKKIKIPCRENSKINGYKNKYIFSKFIAEKIVRFYQENNKIINVRLSNIYGPSLLERPDIIISIFNKILKKKKVQIMSDIPARDFIHVNDVADGIIKLLKSDFTGNINLGTGKHTSIKKIIKIITKITGAKIFSKQVKVTGPTIYSHDIALLKKYTKWQPKIDVSKGMMMTWKKMKHWNKKLNEFKKK